MLWGSSELKNQAPETQVPAGNFVTTGLQCLLHETAGDAEDSMMCVAGQAWAHSWHG